MNDNDDEPRTDPYIIGLREDFAMLVGRGRLAQKERTLAWSLFPHRIRTIEIELCKGIEPLRARHSGSNGAVYDLLSTRLVRKKGSPTIVKAQYVLVEGFGLPPINLRTELENVAGFGRLKSRKVAARLDLLQSPANMRDGEPLLFDLCPSDLKEIPEIAREGCGFMPLTLAQKFMGDHAIGNLTFALQVRIFSSKHGLFKGMLVAKPGITTVQLPPSMKKVGPSERDLCNKAFLLINGLFPSVNNAENMTKTKLFNRQKAQCHSFNPNELCEMYARVLECCLVPRHVVETYRNQSKVSRGLQHAYFVGTTDPTSSIPSGHVFVTGVHSTPIKTRW